MDVDAHGWAFTAAVASGDWSRFVAGSAPQASMELVGPPVGSSVGRDVIARPYVAAAPHDTVENNGATTRDGAELVVRHRWTTIGDTGTMCLTADDDGQISRPVVTFD
jgi:hypothetical protein